MKIRYTYEEHTAVYTVEEFVKAFNEEYISDLGYLEVIQ